VNTLCALLDRDVISVEEVRAALIEDPDSGLNSLDPEAIPEPSQEEMGMMGEPSVEGMEAQELDEGHLEQEAMMGMDAKEDDLEWITTENGVHIPLKNGETKKEAVEEFLQDKSTATLQPIQNTSPNIADFKKKLKEYSGNNEKTARAYFKEYFDGKYINRMIGEVPAQIHFAGQFSWHEFSKKMKLDPIKAEAIIHLADVLKNGTMRYEKKKHAKSNISGIYTFEKEVTTESGPIKVLVDVAIRPRSEKILSAYSYNHSLSRDYVYRMAHAKDEQPSMFADIIDIRFEG
jgi:hypothetical protein